jgi:hypothetical protein
MNRFVLLVLLLLGSTAVFSQNVNFKVQNKLLMFRLGNEPYRLISPITSVGPGLYINPKTGMLTLTGGSGGVGFSGSYTDLTNRPVLFSGNYSDLAGKPTLFSGSYTDLTNRPTLFSGSYADLTNKPTIPTVPSALSAFTNDVGYVTAAGAQTTFDARYRRQSVLVDYINDVTNKPTIPTNTSQLTNGAGFATTTDVTNAVAGKQSTLVSGTNIKTVNGTSLLGSGDIIIAGGAATTNASALTSGTLDDARLSSNVATLTGAQSLTNKTVNGVTPATFGYLDPTSSIQTQLDGKQATLGFTPYNATNPSGYQTATGVQTLGDARYPVLSGSYANPAWITALDPAKVTQSATYRFSTDAEKAIWNGKQDALGFTPYNATNPSGFQTSSQVTTSITNATSPISTSVAAIAATANAALPTATYNTNRTTDQAATAAAASAASAAQTTANAALPTTTYNTNRTADQAAAANASNLTTGKVPIARLGTGTPVAGTYLDGSGVWTTLPAGGAIVSLTQSGTLIDDGSGPYNGDASVNASKAFDGLSTTFYDAAGDAPGKYVGRDFGSPTSVNQVTMLPRPDAGNAPNINGAQVQWSTDNATWTTVYSVSGVTGSNYTQLITANFTPVLARYVRLYYPTASTHGNVAEITISYIPASGGGTVDTLNTIVTRTQLAQQFANSLVPVIPTSSAIVPVASGMYIFNYPKTVEPGQPINVQGAFPDGSTLKLAVGGSTTYINVPINGQQEANTLTGVLPESSSLPPNQLYRIWVVNPAGTGRTPDIYLNKAEGWFFDSPEVVAGLPMEVVGANLVVSGVTPTVRMVSTTTATSLTCAVNTVESNSRRVIFTAPSGLVVGQKYTVVVNNGIAPTSIGDGLARDTLTAITVQPDVYGMGVAYATKFASYSANVYNIMSDARVTTKPSNNAGVQNVRTIVQNTLNLARDAGGGTVLLPAGKWRIDSVSGGSVGVDLRNRTILRGAGVSSTTLIIGTAMNGDFALYKDAAVYQAGVMDMTIVIESATGGKGSRFGGTETILKNLLVIQKNGEWWVSQPSENPKTNKIALNNVYFDQLINDNIHGPLNLSGSTYVKLTDCTFDFSMGPSFEKSQKVIVNRTKFIKDVAKGKKAGGNVILHTAVINFIRDSYFGNCDWLAEGGEIERLSNDNESPIAEDTELYDMDNGTVGSATLTTLTDGTKTWGTSFNGNMLGRKPYVYITWGTGVGQYREITSRTATVLTVDRPWDVVPDATSKYAINYMTIERTTMINNQQIGMQRGPCFYFASGNDVSVEYSNFINSGSIYLGPVQLQRTGFIQLCTMYNTRLAYNTFTSPNDPDNGNNIGVIAVQNTSGASIGPQAINTQIIGNNLYSPIPNKRVYIDDPGGFPEGIVNYLFFQSTGYVNTVPAIWGTTVWKTNVSGANPGINTNAGSRVFTLKNTQITNSPLRLQNNERGIGSSIKMLEY